MTNVGGVSRSSLNLPDRVGGLLPWLAAIVLGVGSLAHPRPAVAQAVPPSIQKAFGATQIAPGGTTTLTFTLSNSILNPTLTGVGFTDTLPAGLVVATPNGSTGSCIGGGTVTAVAGSNSISLSGATIDPGPPGCGFAVNVTGVTPGFWTNTTGNVTSNEGGTGGTASASLTVNSPPEISKSFGAASIPVGGTTSMTFIMTNSNSVSLTEVQFSDTLPAGLVVATPNGFSPGASCTNPPFVTATAGSSSVNMTDGAFDISCEFSVNVTGTTAGVKNNTTGVITSLEGGTGSTSNTATLTVIGPPTISKAFAVAGMPLNGTTSLTFTLANPNTTVSAAGVAFTDTLQSGLVVATPNGLTNNCGGTATATAGSSSISLTGGTIAASGTCKVVVDVTGTTTGVKNNTTSAISSTNGGTGATSNTATLTVAQVPTIQKAFGAASIRVGDSTSLSFTISNPNTIPLTGVGFSDNLPAGLVVSSPNGLTGSCGVGTITAVAGSGTVGLSGATLAASGSCTFSVNVTGTAEGPKSNTTGAVASAETGPAFPSNTAVITVTAGPPTIQKSFGAATITIGGSTTLSFTVANTNLTTLTGVGFTDTLPTGLVVSTPNGLTGSCGGGTITAVAGSGSISLSGATLAASGSCTFSVNVTGTTAGTQNNLTGTVTSTEGGAGGTASASIFVEVLAAVPTLGPGALVTLLLLLGAAGWFAIRGANP